MSPSQRLVYRQNLDYSNAAMKRIYEQGSFWSVPSPYKYATWEDQKRAVAYQIAKVEMRQGLWLGMSLTEAASNIQQTKLNPNWELTERQKWFERIKKEAHEFAERKMTQRNQKPIFTSKPSPLRQSWTPPSPSPPPPKEKKARRKFSPRIQKFRHEMFTWPLLMNEELELYQEKEEKAEAVARVLLTESEWSEKKVEFMQVPSHLMIQRTKTLAAMDRLRSILVSLNTK